jgi:hypothetical protein
MSSLVNKVKEALHSDHGHKASTTHHEGEHGPHNSKVANAADPRVDSDLDGSKRVGAGNTTTTGTGMTGSGLTGTHAGAHTGAHAGTHNVQHQGMGMGGTAPGPAPNTAGPHKSDMLNKADPRVDSDMDGGRNMGATSMGGPGTTYGTTTGAGAGALGGQHAVGSHGVGSHGVASTGMGTTGVGSHGVGSHGVGSHGVGGVGSTTAGTTGFNDPEGTHGPHNSRMMNAADPRVDSDRDHRGTAATSGFGTGPAHNTAGPHKSDMLNKADPRVDSDLDGSKTMGGNKTFGA